MARHRYLVVFFSLSLGTVESVVAQESRERFEKVTQRLVQAINAQGYAATRQDFAQPMLDSLTLEKSKQFFKKALNQFGKIEEVGSPRWTAPNRAVFIAHCVQRDMEITVVLDEHNKIARLTILPPRPPIPVPDTLVTSFHLPFDGEWFAVWGGDSKELTVTYNRSCPDAAKVHGEYRVRFDYSESLLANPIVVPAKDGTSIKLPDAVTIKPGGEIVTSLEIREGDWRRVGKEIHYRLRAGAPFTFGRALGLGNEPIDHGTQLFIDGVAVLNRVLGQDELKELAFSGK